MAASLAEYARMSGPALAQAAQQYGPAIAEGVKAGVQKGLKEGILSIRNPQKASKYTGINSIQNLAMAPGNIGEIIEENISEAAERSGSQTPFLNSVFGQGTGNTLHKTAYNRRPSVSKYATLSPLTPSAAQQARWQDLSSQKFVPYAMNAPKWSPPVSSKPSGPQMRGGKKKTQKKRKSKKRTRRHRNSRTH